MAECRRLVILDLNGTILNRLTHEREMKAFRLHPVVMKKALSSNVTVHGSKVIFRPHALAFLEGLFKNFDVAVWTSSRPKNAFSMVHYAFSSLLDFNLLWKQARAYDLSCRDVLLGPSDREAQQLQQQLLHSTTGRHSLKFVWTQHECDTIQLPQKKGGSGSFVKPLRKKDLNKVWRTHPHYNALNTIIVDDTSAKLADHNENHLSIPEFSVINHEVDFTQDEQLLSLSQYFEELLQSNPSDVRTFLKNKPFVF
jgi:hypothetical protein